MTLHPIDPSKWVVKEKHNLKLRKTPITRLIHEAVLKLDMEPAVIRRELNSLLDVEPSRRSQIETIRKDNKIASLTAQQVVIFNAFFTEILGRDIDITARVADEGLFSEVVG